MPEETIVASWRVMIVRSRGLTLLKKSMLISFEPLLSAMSRTISPRALSWSETACLDSASTSPLAGRAGEVDRLEDEVVAIAGRGGAIAGWRRRPAAGAAPRASWSATRPARG